MMKIPEKSYERTEPEGRGKPFTEIIRAEIRVNEWMERGWDPPSDEVLPTDALLKVSTFNDIVMIERSLVERWKIVN